MVSCINVICKDLKVTNKIIKASLGWKDSRGGFQIHNQQIYYTCLDGVILPWISNP